ncbi:MAG TPA: hypothetical protein VNL18_12525 [Gemmatimonadales bacterium]|nr:hypothetical protein [Gemmatimonadales bacterium]
MESNEVPTYTLVTHTDYDKDMVVVVIQDATGTPVARVPFSRPFFEQVIPSRGYSIHDFPIVDDA